MGDSEGDVVAGLVCVCGHLEGAHYGPHGRSCLRRSCDCDGFVLLEPDEGDQGDQGELTCDVVGPVADVWCRLAPGHEGDHAAVVVSSWAEDVVRDGDVDRGRIDWERVDGALREVHRMGGEPDRSPPFAVGFVQGEAHQGPPVSAREVLGATRPERCSNRAPALCCQLRAGHAGECELRYVDGDQGDGADRLEPDGGVAGGEVPPWDWSDQADPPGDQGRDVQVGDVDDVQTNGLRTAATLFSFACAAVDRCGAELEAVHQEHSAAAARAKLAYDDALGRRTEARTRLMRAVVDDAGRVTDALRDLSDPAMRPGEPAEGGQ